MDADQDSVIADGLTPETDRSLGAEGGVVSGGGGGGGHVAVATFAVVVPETFPAASTAATPSV